MMGCSRNEAIVARMQHMFVRRHGAAPEPWGKMLFSTSFLLPVMESVDVQAHRAHVFALPSEEPDPIDAEAAYAIVLRVAVQGPSLLAIQTRPQAQTCVYNRLVREFIVPRRYARKQAFATVGAREKMVAPPPGAYRMRNPSSDRLPWGATKCLARTCNNGEVGRRVQAQKAAFRAAGY